MAFHFHHRKLLNDSLSNLLDTCKQSCDIIQNFNGTCPSPCSPICLPICSLPCPPPIADSDKPRQVSLLLIACLAILAIAFFLFACYIIYKFYIIWRSSSRRPQQEEAREDEDEDEDEIPELDHPIWYIRTIGLQPSEINAITIVKYKRGDGLVEGTDCAVCLSEFEEDETLRLLPQCNHAFHIPCIDTWLGSHTNCPMCRAAVAAAPSDPEEAPSESFRIGSDDNQSEVEMNDVEGGDCKIDLGGFEDGMQTVRRSVSMDSLSASMISAAIANALPELVRVEDGSKRGGSSSIKRSASCSAKVFLSRHSSRSRN